MNLTLYCYCLFLFYLGSTNTVALVILSQFSTDMTKRSSIDMCIIWFNVSASGQDGCSNLSNKTKNVSFLKIAKVLVCKKKSKQ